MKKLRKVRARRIDTIEAYSCAVGCSSMCFGVGAPDPVRRQNDVNRWRQVAG